MDSQDIKKTVSYKLFLFDMFFNWFLGILFLFFHRFFDDLIGNEPLLPELIWIIIGEGLLLFSFWQTYIVILNKISKNDFLFSCIMAWVPFIMLAYVLAFMEFALKAEARILIWIGDFYMFILGFFYLRQWYKMKRYEIESKHIRS